MEDGVSRSIPPLEQCRRDVAECDVYVGVFAWRYGEVPSQDNPDKKSFTELELDHAEKCGIDRLTFVLDAEAAWPAEHRDTATGQAEAGARIAALRRRVQIERWSNSFESKEQLALDVVTAVDAWLQDSGEKRREQYLRDVVHAVEARFAGGRLHLACNMFIRHVRVAAPLGPGWDQTTLLDAILRAGNQPVFEIVGDVGSGKTELVHWLAAELARARSTNVLPLLLRARDLLEESFEGAAEVSARSLTSVPIRELLADRNLRWCVFIDALDEAGHAAEESLRPIVGALKTRVQAIVVTTRPSTRLRIFRAQFVRLSSWTAHEVERFLDLWAERDAGAVEAIRCSPGKREVMRTLFTSALAATLCMSVADRSPEGLRSPAQVFDQVLVVLFQTWSRERAGNFEWKTVAGVLRTLALRIISAEALHVSEPDIDALLPPDDRVPPRTAILGLGILVPRGRSYDFALRGIAEFLAGERLAEEPASLDRASAAAWGVEAARHAFGVVRMRKGPAVAVEELRALCGAARDPQNTDLQKLRRALVAIRAAADLGDHAAPISRELAQDILHRLLDEHTVWMSDPVLEAAESLARAGGPVWEELRKHAFERLLDDRSVVDWYASRELDVQTCRMMLRHQDQRVRKVAIRALATRLDQPDAVTLLRFAARDETYEFETPPAYLAAFALQCAPREEEMIASFNRLLRNGSQVVACAAAYALLRGEADPAQVERARAFGSNLMLELSLGPFDGRSVLFQRPPEKACEGLQPPCSPVVRKRLLKLLLRAIGRSGDEYLAEVEKVAAKREIIEAAALVADEYPALIVRLLEQQQPNDHAVPLSTEAQETLARVCLRRADLRAALLACWRHHSVVNRALYPARALELLVARKDVEAAEIYAGCLRHSLGAHGFLNAPLPLADVLIGPVLEVAREHCREVIDRGNTNQAHKPPCGVALSYWPRVWQDDEHTRSILHSWAASSDPNAIHAALLALEPVAASVPPCVRDSALAGIHRLAREGGPNFEIFDLPDLVLLIGRLGWVPAAAEMLRELIARRSAAIIHAAAVLAAHVSEEEGRAISEWAARHLGNGTRIDAIDRELMRALIATAPEVWCESLKDRITAGISPEMVMLSELLPTPQRAEVLIALRESAYYRELPWIRTSTMKTIRPIDQIRKLLFEAGLE